MAGARLDKRGEEGGVVTRTDSTMGGEDIGVSQTKDNTHTCVLQVHDIIYIILYMYISKLQFDFLFPSAQVHSGGSSAGHKGHVLYTCVSPLPQHDDTVTC